MSSKFLHEDLWPTLTSRIKGSKRNFVAVAYLGKGAKRQLPLHRNDVLVVDVSPAAVKSGETNPSEIEKYLKLGVVVHSCPNLHAKVFVMDNAAIIGSGNASRRSKNILLEAGLLTTDSKSSTAARAFVQSCMGELVTPAYVRECKRIYRSPRISAGGAVVSRKADHPRIWVERLIKLMRKDPNKKQAAVTGEKKAIKQVRQKRKFFVDYATFPAWCKIARNAQFDDLIIEVWKEEDGEFQVYPPMRVIHKLPYISRMGAKKIMIFLVGC